jgi:hypothetical protein
MRVRRVLLHAAVLATAACSDVQTEHPRPLAVGQDVGPPEMAVLYQWYPEDPRSWELPKPPSKAAPSSKQRSSRSTRYRPAPEGSGGGDLLARIRACESGGDYSAVSASGKYRGAYQFSRATWASVAPSDNPSTPEVDESTQYPDPATAPATEQDARAARLLARSGAGQWPVCGRR